MPETKNCNCAGAPVASAPLARSSAGVVEVRYISPQSVEHEVYGKDTGVFYGLHSAGQRFWVTARDQSAEPKRFVRV